MCVCVCTYPLHIINYKNANEFEKKQGAKYCSVRRKYMEDRNVIIIISIFPKLQTLQLPFIYC